MNHSMTHQWRSSLSGECRGCLLVNIRFSVIVMLVAMDAANIETMELSCCRRLCECPRVGRIHSPSFGRTRPT